MEEKPIAKITHYYDKLGVAILDVYTPISVGDKIKLMAKDGSPFTQEVSSIQIEHQNIEKAKKGQEVGVKVEQRVKENALVYAA